MYATCLFCNSALGANESIAHFPVGRRLAYDAANGRLWVVCRACERWNLSPLESRWEAIEEAERAFRGTKVRVSSDNIGLARLPDGTELVRIGKPPRAEFAVWRYGDQFGSRQWRSVRTEMVPAIGGLGVFAMASRELLSIGSVGTGAAALLVSGALALNLGSNAWWHAQRWRRHNQLRAVIQAEDGSPIHLSNVSAREMAFVTGGRDFDWKLKVPRNVLKPTGRLGRLLGVASRAHYNNDRVFLHGDAAVRALAIALPHVNSDGGSKKSVRKALDVINETDNVRQLLQRASICKPKHRADLMDDAQATLAGIPAPMRLALEMVLHEDDERRAMEGELQALEQRWQEADAIAKIADQLLMSPAIEHELTLIKQREQDR